MKAATVDFYILQQRMLSNMKIEAAVVSHYLYGYQTMRLASQDEIKTFSISGNLRPKAFSNSIELRTSRD